MKICASLTSGDKAVIEKVMADAEMVEFRFDLMLQSPTDVRDYLASDRQIIATCRKGAFTELRQKACLHSALTLGATYADLDMHADQGIISGMQKVAVELDKKIIISMHDFEHTPDKPALHRFVNQGFNLGADIVKIAAMVRRPADNARLLSLYEDYSNVVILGMGELGKASRLAALYCGAPFMYASVDDEGKAAPGQINYHKLMHLRDELLPENQD